MSNLCNYCIKAGNCTRATGILYGFCKVDFEPLGGLKRVDQLRHGECIAVAYNTITSGIMKNFTGYYKESLRLVLVEIPINYQVIGYIQN